MAAPAAERSLIAAATVSSVPSATSLTPSRERAFLSAVGFTTAFATARGITHAIRAGVGPFHNISEGGPPHPPLDVRDPRAARDRLPLDLPARRWGPGQCRRWPSRVSAAAYGVAAALTLDEFALWLDLHDDYWDKQGRKSIDAVALFGGLLTIGVSPGAARCKELGPAPQGARALRCDSRAACGGVHGAVEASSALNTL